MRVPFPYVEQGRKQARPALIVSNAAGPGGMLLWTVMITSARRGSWPGDVPVGDKHADYGLPVPCFVRTAKITALETRSIERREGRLSDPLLQAVREQLRLTLGW